MYRWMLPTHWLLLRLLQFVCQNYFVHPLCVICYSDKNARAIWDGTSTARNNDTKNHFHFVLLTNEWATIISLRRKNNNNKTNYFVSKKKKNNNSSVAVPWWLAAKRYSNSMMSIFLHFNYCICLRACGGQKITCGGWFSLSTRGLNSAPLAWPQVP